MLSTRVSRSIINGRKNGRHSLTNSILTMPDAEVRMAISDKDLQAPYWDLELDDLRQVTLSIDAEVDNLGSIYRVPFVASPGTGPHGSHGPPTACFSRNVRQSSSRRTRKVETSDADKVSLHPSLRKYSSVKLKCNLA